MEFGRFGAQLDAWEWTPPRVRRILAIPDKTEIRHIAHALARELGLKTDALDIYSATVLVRLLVPLNEALGQTVPDRASIQHDVKRIVQDLTGTEALDAMDSLGFGAHMLPSMPIRDAVGAGSRLELVSLLSAAVERAMSRWQDYGYFEGGRRKRRPQKRARSN